MLMSEALGVEHGRLTIGGADAISICEEYGTPVYIMDEGLIRKNCRTYIDSLKKYYAGESRCAFASKAFSCAYIYRLLKEEGMLTDVASGGELYTAYKAGFGMGNVYFHGNCKSDEEIELGLKYGVGRFVVDSAEELARIDAISSKLGIVTDISFRITPGVEAHTHEFIRTGQIDSKFGLPLETGAAFAFVQKALEMKHVRLIGVNCHIGSQIFDIDPFELAGQLLIGFIAEIKAKLNYEIEEVNLGGGYGIKYLENDRPVGIEDCVASVAAAVTKAANDANLSLPRLVMEPGRSIVGAAGITVYRVGAIKHIPNIRSYIAVDGGMGDNPRYIIYRAEYDALLCDRPQNERTTRYTVAGRYCESGDVLIENILLPEVKAGDYLAVLSTGAYNYSMASNYNRVPRLPVVMVRDGAIRLAVRRETYDDVIACDLLD